VSRAGLWFLQIIQPYPRLAAFLHYVRHPGVFLRKLLQGWRRRRGTPSYSRALRQGRLLVKVGEERGSAFLTVATPVYRVAETHLRAAIASVRAQTYPNWELVLLDDASPDPHVRRVIDEAARSDRRIRAVQGSSNLGIALASNRIIDAARGEYVAFLDHDDLLHPRALEMAARFLAANREVDWLFSDEDKVDERGRHSAPCIKPGWSHHLLLTFNYVCHLRVVRRALLQRIGGHRAGFDGAQDYDLALRALAAGGRFAHLPGILYHWRTVATSMARAAAAKPAAHAHALRALAEHAEGWPRGGPVSAEVLLAPASFFLVRRRPDEDTPLAVVTPHEAPRLAGRPLEVLTPTDTDLDGAGLFETLARATSPLVGVPPPQGWSAEEVDELLALLLVPHTTLVAGRQVRRKQVAASGWVVADDGSLCDPWAGHAVNEFGYLNLDLVPGPRTVPPATGWIAWREALLAALEAAREAPEGWRLPLGLACLGMEVVTTPMASFEAAAGPPAAPPLPTPPRLASRWSRWLDDFHLARCSVRLR
jgi:GT2 family glycosyltransferase